MMTTHRNGTTHELAPSPGRALRASRLEAAEATVDALLEMLARLREHCEALLWKTPYVGPLDGWRDAAWAREARAADDEWLARAYPNQAADASRLSPMPPASRSGPKVGDVAVRLACLG